MTKIGSLFLFLSLIFVPPAWSMISVQASMDPQKVGLGDDFTFSVTILSTEIIQVAKPRPPDLSGFELLETSELTAVAPKMVQTPQGMDWQTQRKKIYNYHLRPKRGGRLQIGAFEVVVDGKPYNTQPLVIDVLAKSQAASQRRQRPSDDEGMPPGFGFPGSPSLDEVDKAEEEIYNQLLQRRRQQPQKAEPQLRTLPKNPNEAFFIQVEVDKTDVFEGEQVTATWYVYTRGQMETLDRVKFPDLRGFWKEIIEEVPTIQFTEEIINGVPYRKALLASHALFPLKPGVAVIDEYKIKSRVRLSTGGFGLGKAYEYTKSSERVEVKVKPLPTEGRPGSFTGAVGTFDVHTSVDTDVVPVGQPFNLHIRFEGSGNAKGIELPAITWPPTLEVYDTKSESKFFRNGRSYKQFEVLLIPRKEGEVEVPAFEFSMFDPIQKRYETRKTQPLHLKVVANPNAPAGGASSSAAKPSDPASAGTTPSQTPVAKSSLSGDRLPDPVQGFQGASITAPLFNSSIFWAAIYMAVLAALGFKGRNELMVSQRRRDLEEIFRNRWKKFEKTKKTGDHRRIGTDMVNLYYLVLGGIAGDQGASEEVGKVLEKIPPSLRREFGDELSRRIEVFQTLAFAPEEALGTLKSPERLEKEISESRHLLSTMVKRLTESNE